MTDTLQNRASGKSALSSAVDQGKQAGGLVALCFTASMLLSALLLFFVQPMFAKMALPLLGGASGVWNTAMVFFQAVLLGGYLYAHLLSKYFEFRIQILLHGIVMSLAMFVLPIALPSGWEAPATGTPTFWLLGLFGVALGAPFFALSANAPLLQKWFSYTNHKSANDPYFLYAASNAGSLASLLVYPVLVEPFSVLSTQSFIWALGFALLIAMVLGSGFFAEKHASTKDIVANATVLVKKPLSAMRRATWVGYAILPSSLMLGVTAHLTSNVASAPFLWVMPLALYLLTFIVAFSPRPAISFSSIERVFPYVAAGAIFLISVKISNFAIEVFGNLLCFYVIAQMCHNRLADDRPPSENLTEFYFYMSLGGVIGGALTALAAPLLFNDVYEYHLMIAATGLVAVGAFPEKSRLSREILMALSCVAGIALFISFSDSIPTFFRNILLMAVVLAMFTGVHMFRKSPLRLFAVLLALALTGISLKQVLSGDEQKVIFSDRSFFGVSKVIRMETDDGPLHIFQHGNTKHNVQLRAQEALNYPLAYYSPGGSFGQAISAVREKVGQPDVAIIGLGAGAMACHVQPAERWKFYEIDPLVVEMARNQSLFTYVNNCAPHSPIVTGDARLKFESEASSSFDLIMVDAFSSDAIPAHLVTVEALDLYRSKLKDGGFVFFHTSNRNLDVSSVVLNVAKASGLASRYIVAHPSDDAKYRQQVTPSAAVLVGESDAALDELLADYPEWKSVSGSEIVGVWRDDFSHVLGALLANLRDGQKLANETSEVAE
ncbi:MAG: fused MFS/spermidine synthase [Pseudomonadota bacterium]